MGSREPAWVRRAKPGLRFTRQVAVVISHWIVGGLLCSSRHLIRHRQLWSLQPQSSAPQIPRNVINPQRKMRLRMNYFLCRFFGPNSSLPFPSEEDSGVASFHSLPLTHSIPSGTDFWGCMGYPLSPVQICITSSRNRHASVSGLPFFASPTPHACAVIRPFL